MNKLPILIFAVVLQMTVSSYAGDLSKAAEEISSKHLIENMQDVYNLSVDTREDEICKNIILTGTMKVAKGRSSRPDIQGSGILNLKYAEIEVRNMSDVEIMDLYKFLRGKLPSDLDDQPLSKLGEMPENEQVLLAIRGITLIALEEEINVRTPASYNPGKGPS